MAYTQYNPAKPDPTADNGTNAFNNTRFNLNAIRDGVIMNNMPGWNVTPSGTDLSQPTLVTYNKVNESIKADVTWNVNGVVTKIIYSYKALPGDPWSTVGTITITYDANQNFTGLTWS